jgi:hypothetical protein
MKTIVQNFVSEFLVDESDPVYFYDDKVVVGEPTKLVIWCCNINNSSIYKEVTPPEDWASSKYCFNGIDWTLNPDYVEPTTPQE